MFKLINGDCIEVMDKLIMAGVKVDAVITDPPYGTTACKWDIMIPFIHMWYQLNQIIKPNGAIVLTSSQPFTSLLVSSNIKNFRHEWIWEKNIGSNFAALKYQPMKEHENILVFGLNKVNYYPIKEERKGSGKNRSGRNFISNQSKFKKNGFLPTFAENSVKNKISTLRYPSSVQKFNREVGLHPTQKPVALMEYLIKTYTNPGETVLDFTMGSGTTGVACLNTNRYFIGIEKDPEYFEMAKERINKTIDEKIECIESNIKTLEGELCLN